MEKAGNKNNPSERIIDATPTMANEAYISLLLGLINNTNEIITAIRYSGSDIPNNEFWITLGSKTKTAAAKIEYDFGKNLLLKR
jgi:hypothetical protein